MDFTEKIVKAIRGQKWDNDEDRLLQRKKDRRMLPNVPDLTGIRSTVDRRGSNTDVGNDNIQRIMQQKDTGTRYYTKMSVRIDYSDGQGRSVQIQAQTVDVSSSGMLLIIEDFAKFKEICQIKEVKLHFRITPGDMPEGYEMPVHVAATVVRSYQENGKFFFGVQFKQDLKKYASYRKDRYMLTISAILLAGITACILLMRAESVIYFRFNETLYLYSIVAAIFLLSRYIFGAFYRPVEVNPEYTPGVSIIIPCFNEETWIQRTILSCLDQNYPPDKLEVIVVDDCSTDRSVEKIQEIIAKLVESESERSDIKERVSYYVQPRNAGKREALVEGVLRAKHELVVFVDSDSFLDSFAIRHLVQPFQDPKMGGVAGRTEVANT